MQRDGPPEHAYGGQPVSHRRRLRTTNAEMAEISVEWETGRIYLNPESE